MVVGCSNIEIERNEKAREVYAKIRKYGMDKSKQDIEIVSFSRDDMKYTWDETIYQLMNTCIKTHLSHPNDNYFGRPRIAKLSIEIYGEENERKTSLKRLEEITGAKL